MAVTFCPTTGKEQLSCTEAKRVLGGVRARRRRNREQTAERSTYKCRDCGYYHLTRQTR